MCGFGAARDCNLVGRCNLAHTPACMQAQSPSRNRVQSPNITQAKGSGGWVLSLGSGAWVRHSSRTTGLRQWSGVIGQPDRWLDRKKPPGGLSSYLPGCCLRPWGWSGPCRHAHRRHPPCLASPSWASAIPRPSSLRVLERRLMRKVIPKGEKAFSKDADSSTQKG